MQHFCGLRDGRRRTELSVWLGTRKKCEGEVGDPQPAEAGAEGEWRVSGRIDES